MKAKVMLFKSSGKYYTEEEWLIPAGANDPSDMRYSPNYRTISGGPVLVESQEPWGYPFLLLTSGQSEFLRPRRLMDVPIPPPNPALAARCNSDEEE